MHKSSAKARPSSRQLSPLAASIRYAIASGLIGSCAPGFAQAPADQPQETQRVIVTGSQLKRVDAETPAPVLVLTAQDLKNSGLTSVADVLANITANGAGTLSSNNSWAFAGGASGIALRGLSVGATLTLIDGHRMAPYPLADDGERQFVDVSNIPFDAIERIEVLKDGASAVYGSDAIAGVINVILKKNFTGSNVSGEIGTSQHGGGTTEHATYSFGFGDRQTDGYNAFIALEYRHQGEIKASQRSGLWTNTNWTNYGGGNNLTPGMGNNTNGGLGVTQVPYLVSTTNPQQTEALGSLCPTYATTGCPFANPMILQPEKKNVNVLGSMDIKVSPDWDLSLKASVFDSQGAQHNSDADPFLAEYLASYPFIYNSGNTSFGPGRPVLANQGLNGQVIVPANAAGNTLGTAAYINGVIPGVGMPTTRYDSTAYRFAADLTGSVGDWDLGASFGMTRVDTHMSYSNLVNNQTLQNEIDAGTFLIDGTNNAATLASIAPGFSNTATDELDYVELRASRDVMQLRGGPLSVGVGAGIVYKDLNNPLAAPFESGQVVGGPIAYAIGQQTDTSAYAELAAPVLKSLELDAAERFDHVNTYGNSYTPKLGFKFKPIDQFALRGTFSKGFRAPSTAESGNAGLVFGLGNPLPPDPLNCPGGGKSPTDITATCTPTPTYLQTTNPALKPETSKSYTLGTILEPIKGWSSTIDFYSIEIDHQITSLAELSTYQPYAPGVCVRGPAQVLPTEGGGDALSPAGIIAYCNSPYVNANSTKTNGIDVETQYTLKLANADSLLMRVEYSFMFEYKLTANGVTYELAGTHGPSGVSGDTGNPRDRSKITLTYDHGPLDVSAVLNRIGGFNITDPSAGIPTCADALAGTPYYQGVNNPTPPASFCNVKPFLDTDVTMHYAVNKGLTVEASVLNLFDKSPPLDMQTYAGGYLPYNPSLHMAGVVGRFFNVGASYRF